MARKRLTTLAPLACAFLISALSALALADGTTKTAEAKPLSKPRLFTTEECLAVQDFWAQPGRYVVQYTKDDQKGSPWQAVYSSTASEWLYRYYKIRSRTKINPTANPAATDPKSKAWEDWIDKKYDFDRFTADQVAFKRNSDEQNEVAMRETTLASDPGPCPKDLLTMVGQEPPTFFVTAKPKGFTITFDDYTVAYRDNVTVRKKYPYFRFQDGVNSEGLAVKKVSATEMKAVNDMAGLTPTECKVMGAVSPLEGGFDSVNTYDTGFVSAGMLQFATLKEGSGSLGEVLVDLKENDPQNFENDFRHFGVDVAPDGTISVVDVYTAEERQGPEANLEVIMDKRLAAVFQRAGNFRPFRAAQLRVARKMFYPAQNRIAVTIDGQVFEAKVQDVIKSEAGLATLMDRKVNTGQLSPLSNVLTSVASEHKVKNIAQLGQYEAEIIKKMQYRGKYLGVKDLTQPPGVTVSATPSVAVVTKPAKKKKKVVKPPADPTVTAVG